MKRKQIAKEIIDVLIDYDYVNLPYELYEKQKNEAIKLILDRLDNYILIQGEVIE